MHLLLLILHVLGATVIVGTSFVSLFILIKKRVPMEHLEFLEALWKIVGPAIGIQVLTGIALASMEWDNFRLNPFFWTKMVLFVIVGIVGGAVLGKQIRTAKTAKDGYMPGISRWAWIDFLLFATIAALGVTIAELH